MDLTKTGSDAIKEMLRDKRLATKLLKGNVARRAQSPLPATPTMAPKDINEEVSRCIIQMLLKEPFFAHLLSGVVREISDRVPHRRGGPVAEARSSSFGQRGILSQGKLTTASSRVAVIKHETLHLVFKHIFRMDIDKHDPLLFNIAADIVVNQFIGKMEASRLGGHPRHVPRPGPRTRSIAGLVLQEARQAWPGRCAESTRAASSAKGSQDGEGQSDGDGKGGSDWSDSLGAAQCESPREDLRLPHPQRPQHLGDPTGRGRASEFGATGGGRIRTRADGHPGAAIAPP